MDVFTRLMVLVVCTNMVALRSVNVANQGQNRRDQENIEIENFRRSMIDNPDVSVTDRIVFINQGLVKSKKEGLFEADIVLTDHDHVDMSTSGDIDGPIKTSAKRNAQRIRQGLWRTRLVPYEINKTAMADSELASIKNAILDFNKHSCLQWKPKTSDDKNWVKFVKKVGCSSSVGKHYWTNGPQDLTLGSGCYGLGTIQHEMLHASGFWHEQSRPDRNQFVQVMWENILKGMEYNFNKYSRESIDTLNKNYDYGSVMHYGKYGFSKNGLPTLLAIGDPNKPIGQRAGLSKTDILELNALYDCQTPNGGWSTWTEFSPCDSNCYKYRQRFCTAEDRIKVCPEANMYGIQTTYLQCTQQECKVPIDGHWGRWSSWGPCSRTCGNGTQVRTRVCDDPAPKDGGAPCPGSSTETQQCNRRSCHIGPDDCQFEVDFCFWSQDLSGTSSHPWMLISGPTPSSGTGPNGDHTTGSGKYIYSEASDPTKTGDTARIVSKIFPANAGRCMTFWYHMYGDSSMGTLNVYIQNYKDNGLDKVWSRSGNQGKQWKNANLTITESSSSYKIMFESVRGSSYRSDIALDDIMFKDGKCPREQSIAKTTQAPTTAPPADFCNFGTQSNMYCTWYNDPSNDKTPDQYYQFNWWTRESSTPSSLTGPPSGRGGSGYYAYIETSSPYQPDMKAKLLSKQYQASGICFDFWYFMYGKGVGTLNVGVKNTAGYKVSWSQNGDKGEKWLHAKVMLSSSSPFKIVVEGTRGPSYLGDIAIDDLRVTQGPCS